MRNIALRIKQSLDKKQVSRGIIIGAILMIVTDTVYSNIMNINQLNRDSLCILYTSMPRWLFLIYENIFELLVIVLLGVFVSTLIELHLKKTKRFFPKNQVLAFLYGAILPICSCGVIPLIETMKHRVSLKVIITFLIAAPLLNPYIIVLSISVYGIKYCLFRIAASFILAISCGILVEILAHRLDKKKLGAYHACEPICSNYIQDPFVKTLQITKKLVPYILIGGLLSLGLELFNPKQYLPWFSFSNEWLSMLIMAAIGVPIYVCNGADMLLLKPLLEYTDLSMGSAMVFSLTSSSICISSIAMLTKFLGQKITWILVGTISLVSILLGLLINFVY